MNTSEKIATIAMYSFPSRRRSIFNSKQIFSLCLFLLLTIQLYACINIFQGTSENSWIPLDLDGYPIEGSPMDIYIDQVYFMTTTTTTIGYGDFNAKKNPSTAAGSTTASGSTGLGTITSAASTTATGGASSSC